MSVRRLTLHEFEGHTVFLPHSGRTAWLTDAKNGEIRSPIVVPSGWAHIFSRNANPFAEDLSIFVGPKGVGKSTLLHLKRAVVEGWVTGYAPANNVVCLPAADDALSYRSTFGQAIRIRERSSEWKIFSEQDAWTALWRLLLATLVLQADFDRRARNAGSFRAPAAQNHPRDDANAVPQLPVSVSRFFDKEDQRIEPTDIVRCVNSAVGKRMTAEDMSRLYEKELLPLVRKFIGPVKYCMFVDAIDEYLHGDEGMLIDIIQQSWIEDERATASRAPSQGQGSGAKAANAGESYNVWANAQAGLVLAAMDVFEDSGRKIRVFAPIRSEAFHAAAKRVAEAQLSTCAPVVYSKDTLETIVRLNMAIDLEVHHQIEFASPNPETLRQAEMAFFGGRPDYGAIGGGTRSWVSEVVRFSMERPRELMMIGTAISRSKCPYIDAMSPTEILGKLHSALPEVLHPFLRFIVGSRVAEHLQERVFPFVRSNVLSYEELQDIQAETRVARSLLAHPMCKLYSLGLVGDVMTFRETGEQIQRFRFSSAGQIGGPSSHLPSDASVFVVHPVLASALSTINIRPDNTIAPPYRRNESCPIGDGLPWSTASAPRSITLTLKEYPAAATIEVDGKLVAGTKVKRPRKGAVRPKKSRESRVATAQSRPNVLLVAWLYTLVRLGQDDVSATEIGESIAKLQKTKRIIQRMNLLHKTDGASKGAQAVSVPVCTAMGRLLDGMSDSHDLIIDIRKFLKLHLGVEEGIRVYLAHDGEAVFSSQAIKCKNVTLVEL